MLDNYISESVSEGVSVGDIYVEQALAQLNVAYSLVASYAKDVAYVEYMAEMNGVDIYQEGFERRRHLSGRFLRRDGNR